MPTLTVSELQTRLASDLDLGHQFLHGTDTQDIETEFGTIPTLAKFVKENAAAAGTPDTLVVSLEEPIDSSQLNDYQTTALTGAVILASADASWDGYNGRINLAREGLYEVTIVGKILSLTAEGIDGVWPDNTVMAMGSFVEPGYCVQPPLMNTSAHKLSTVAGIDEVYNFSQWTDKYLFRYDGIDANASHLVPALSCTSFVISELPVRAQYTLVVTVARIGTTQMGA